MAVLAPIAVFCYNRPRHLEKCLSALARNSLAIKSDLFILCDGPRDGSQTAEINEVRAIARTARGFKSVEVLEQPKNVGLANSIIEGVTRLTEDFGRVIVVEDDLVVALHFLKYMNDALFTYEDSSKVAAIHGYMFPVAETLPETFFLRDPGCWGWATWQRAWKNFEPDGRKLLAALEQAGAGFSFDWDGQYDYTGMLKGQIAGENNSWAVRWAATVFLRGELALYPGRSLVQNIGKDGSGTHAGRSKADAEPSQAPVSVSAIDLAENEDARHAMVSYLRNLRERSSAGTLRNLTSSIKSLLSRGGG